MDQSAILAVAMALSGAIAGFLGGKRNGEIAAQTVSLLQTQVEELRLQCVQIPQLHERIAILEEMVTQRAKVDDVLVIVTEIREKLDAR